MEELKITKKSQELYMAAFCGNYENSLRGGSENQKNFCLYIRFEMRERILCVLENCSLSTVYAAK